MKAPKILWWIPEEKGGIEQYSRTLWPYVATALRERGLDPLEPIFSKELPEELPADLAVLHIQHEFGFFGSKLPGRYLFPRILRRLRKKYPNTKITATAHTVIEMDYRYTLQKRPDALLRAISNLTWVPIARHTWRQRTWGALDGVIVHSKYQVESVVTAGCREVVEIPHFVPPVVAVSAASEVAGQVLVFGYFSREKGQDIAIEAMGQLKGNEKLVLGGGVRRPEDQAYFERCQSRIRALGIDVKTTGYLSQEQLQSEFEAASLVLVPFRETSGSGSITEALRRGKAVLASDLLLNQEIAERQPGCLAFFKSESPEDCAQQIQSLLRNAPARRALGTEALKYAQRFTPETCAALHGEFFLRNMTRR
jgi:glycosyltransferase involved in cell wall biosynthesis